MNTRKLALPLLWGAGFAAGLLQARTPQSLEELKVQVYNLAGVPEGTLVQAEETAASIFHNAGIKLLWADCSSLHKEIEHRVCSTIESAPVVIIKILPQVMAERSGIPQRKFGAAVPPNLAFILFDRVEKITRDTGFSRPRVLGHIMAHELGHLMLPAETHSAHGIMSETLISRDCERPGIMLLMFTRAQGGRMRQRLHGERGPIPSETRPKLNDNGAAPFLKIRVYGCPKTSMWLLGAAETETTRMLQRAQIETSWNNCLTKQRTGSCAAQAQPAELVVRIIEKALPEATPRALGMATWFEGSSSAFVFYDRIIALRTGTRPLAAILGRVLAHEIAHLLLPQENHSDVGLMRGQWNADDLRMTSSACLEIPAHSMESMRREVLRRTLVAGADF
jgi:hypothetical protein